MPTPLSHHKNLRAAHRRDDEGRFFLCPISDDGVINRSLITQTYGAVLSPPFSLCYKSHLSRGTRGQKTSKTFSSKKLNRPLTPLSM